MDNDSVGWHDELRMLSKASKPPPVLFELCGLGCCAREYLQVAALELVCGDYFDRFGGWVVMD